VLQLHRDILAIPKMIFITGKVIPVPMDPIVAATRISLSSHVEYEKMRCHRLEQRVLGHMVRN